MEPWMYGIDISHNLDYVNRDMGILTRRWELRPTFKGSLGTMVVSNPLVPVSSHFYWCQAKVLDLRCDLSPWSTDIAGPDIARGYFYVLLDGYASLSRFEVQFCCCIYGV